MKTLILLFAVITLVACTNHPGVTQEEAKEQFINLFEAWHKAGWPTVFPFTTRPVKSHELYELTEIEGKWTLDMRVVWDYPFVDPSMYRAFFEDGQVVEVCGAGQRGSLSNARTCWRIYYEKDKFAEAKRCQPNIISIYGEDPDVRERKRFKDKYGKYDKCPESFVDYSDY